MAASRRRPHRRIPLPARVKRADARVAERINARTTGALSDGFWVGLTRAANHGKLWFAAAAVLLALGRPRAAARGLASLGLASLVANLVGKRLVGGERPALTSIPLARRLERSPTSPSFPSGHTASAAAFATGAALEWPAAGAALAPVAAGVGYSRLHTGAHWLSDVAGGAAIGVAAAVALKVVVPAVKPVVRRDPPTARMIELPATETGEGVFVIVNPGSGRGLGRPSPIPLLRERLPKAHVHELADGDDIGDLIEQALRSDAPPRVLGAYGGDGTVAAVAQRARAADLPLVVFPGGTFNHFAKAALLDSVDATLGALASGSGREVDVAELSFADGETITVLNTASVGIYPAFVEEREKHEKRLGKPIAALIAAIRVVRRGNPLEVEIDGKRRQVWSVFVGVDRYYPVSVAPIERRRLDDHLLDVRILFAGGRPRTRGAVALAFGGRTDAFAARMPFLQGPPALDARVVEEISVEAVGDDPGYAHDGEASAETPGNPKRIAIAIRPGALRVYSPEA
ncbi:bifunctional phosphatase PAP2/diacylglycerol kinase family protein [Leifsonia sp. fls2-241-R2A-40a]|uniref:bifunctional phosphatase PAP2/diacylglycerol kinase family protein n=1 Tax=Leifsonia sp. fls2-241-R2A-40a TaxID=3040290 RepID=UPI00254D0632|nr:bifunctional phosphatase PAP2/diacylglycerol kinase family protein [Leifsonia sp. fls2-241-R2A-40a]